MELIMVTSPRLFLCVVTPSHISFSIASQPMPKCLKYLMKRIDRGM